LRHDLGWLEKDLRALRMIGTLAVTLVKLEDLERDAHEMIARWVCDPRRVLGGNATPVATGLTAGKFSAALEEAKRDLRGVVPRLGDWLKETFALRLALETHKQPYPGMAADLAALLPPDFLRRMPYQRVQHLPRYLRGMQVRAEKYRRDPAKDAARAGELAPFVAAVKRQAAGPRGEAPAGTPEEQQDFRWLVEEFRVSLFAQELGTAEPVSVVRLQRALEEIGWANTPAATAARREETPFLKPSTAAKKGAPLKSLGSLDQLFRK